LLRAVRKDAMPRHIGIILDGNRRHARTLGITDPQAVYDLGARKLDDVLSWCIELNVPTVTLWVFKLCSLVCDRYFHARRIRVRAIGKLDSIPEATRAAIRAIEDATASYESMVLNIAIAYGGRQEIADAIVALLRDEEAEGRTLADAAARLTPEAIGRYLYTAGLPDPDLIIRTSGEVRLSGFMLWQSAHSEFYFADVNWPVFRKIDLLRAIRSYQQRQRRFGI